MKCSYCSHEQTPSIDTYKHTWHVCPNCGTVVREKREELPLKSPLLKGLIKNTVLNRIYGTTLLRDNALETDTDSYTYYTDTVKKGVEGTKWENFNKGTLENLRNFGFEFDGKKILDISGGPGFLSQSMRELGADVSLTEFSDEAAKSMEKALGIKSYKFDYNLDRIHEAVQGPFDLICCIYSISYCNDIKSFLKDLKKLCKAGTKLYLTFPMPSLGLFLRWQYDEYTYSTLHPEKVMQEAFEKEGFKMLQEKKLEGYHYTKNWFTPGKNPILNLLWGVHRKIATKYRKKAEKQLEEVSLKQRGVIQYYEFTGLEA